MTLEPLWCADDAAAPSVLRALEAVDAAQRGLLVVGRFGWDSPTAAQAYRTAFAEVRGGLCTARARLDEALAAAIQHDHAVAGVRASRGRAAALGGAPWCSFGSGFVVGSGAWPGGFR